MQKSNLEQKSSADSGAKVKRLSFSDFVFSQKLKTASAGKKAAFIAVFAALCVIANTYLEIRIFDVQYSLTILISVIAGVALGPIAGGVSSFAADLIGYFINSWGQLYMPWVGLSTAALAFFAGAVNLLFRNNSKKSAFYLKYLIICLLSLFVCTVAINSTGFYFYNKAAGFSTAVLNYVAENFGGGVSYFSYVCYRLFFKLQILNNLVNYALIFICMPMLSRIGAIKDFFR